MATASGASFDEGIAFEREQFMKLMMGAQSAAQRHLFFAERQAAKVDGIPADIQLRPIKKVGVIGAGTMGGGISMNFLSAGIPVTIVETQQAALDRGDGAIYARDAAWVERLRREEGPVHPGVVDGAS